MSYRSSYGTGYSSSSLRRPYTPSYSSSYSPSYSTPSVSSSLYRPSTYSSFLSTYRRPSFGSTSYSSKKTNSSEDLHGASAEDTYNATDSETLAGLRNSKFSRSLGNLTRASAEEDDQHTRDEYGRTANEINYREMYENEQSMRMSEQATLIEDLQAQIELRKEIMLIFEQLTPVDEELQREKERCSLLEQLRSLRDEHERLIRQQQQSSQKPQQRTAGQNNRPALGSRRF